MDNISGKVPFLERWFTRQERTALLFTCAMALVGLGVQAISAVQENSIKQTPFVRPARLSINRASAAELAALSGIGPVLAQRIINDRASRGLYLVADDLLRVKGVSKKMLERIRLQIVFD